MHLFADFHRGKPLDQQFESVGYKQARAAKCHGSVADLRISDDVFAEFDGFLHFDAGVAQGRAIDKNTAPYSHPNDTARAAERILGWNERLGNAPHRKWFLFGATGVFGRPS